MNKFILPLVFFSALAPTNFSKILCVASIILVLLAGLRISSLNKYLGWKLAISLSFLPGIFNSLFLSPENLVRFAPILLLSWLYPYDSIFIDIKILRVICFSLLCWLVVGQILLALGNPGMVTIRDSYYPIETNFWNYEISEMLFNDLREFRAGGVYYNPNVLAGNIFLTYLPLYILRNYSEKQIKWSTYFTSLFHISTFIVGFSLFLSGTRTYIVVFLVMFLLPRFSFLIGLFKSLKINLSNLLLFLSISFLFSLIAAQISSGFDPNSINGSASIKNQILLSYINSSDAIQLIFGGIYNVHFDAEYGYWLGSAGALGLLAVLLFYLMIAANSRTSRPIIFLFLLIGIGNSLLYGLLTSTLIVPVIILLVKEPFIVHPYIRRIGVKINNAKPIVST